MFKKAKENKKGFTLAELLIVVAIIAVLVAISIPIFTSQLEKSREAVDLANIRAGYAEVMSAALTGDTPTAAAETKDTVVYNSTSKSYSYTVDLKQKVADWQTGIDDISIGEIKLSGVTSKPAANGTATISYTPDAAGTAKPTLSFK